MSSSKKVVAFEDMKPKQQAVEVAKDVLKLIKDPKVLVAADSGYLKFPTWAVAAINAAGKSLKHYWKAVVSVVPEDINEDAPVCQVCGIGSLLLSYVDRVNDFNIPNHYTGGISRSEVIIKLGNLFSIEELNHIEAAFELKPYFRYSYYDQGYKKYTAMQEKAIAFGKKYKTDKARLAAIMNNIIDNKGTFKP